MKRVLIYLTKKHKNTPCIPEATYAPKSTYFPPTTKKPPTNEPENHLAKNQPADTGLPTSLPESSLLFHAMVRVVLPAGGYARPRRRPQVRAFSGLAVGGRQRTCTSSPGDKSVAN